MFSRANKWLFSLHFGVGLLILLAFYVTFGTLLPQNLPDAFYVENYSWSAVLLALGFNNAYSSWIFNLIMALFLINLSGCTIKMIPSLQRRYRQDYFPSPKINAENLWLDDATLSDVLNVVQNKGFTVSESVEDPGTHRAVRHRFGVFGPAVTHMGILTIILSSFVGNFFAQEGFFNLMPGESATFHAENFSVSLKDFLSRTGTMDQWSNITATWQLSKRVCL
jgi:cytochrome c biogenesis protein